MLWAATLTHCFRFATAPLDAKFKNIYSTISSHTLWSTIIISNLLLTEAINIYQVKSFK